MPESSPVKVLIIDDEPLVLSTLRNLLLDAGYSVTAVERGDEALRTVSHGNAAPDLALLDMTIGDMEAQRVVAGLRAASPEIRVLLTSGYPYDDHTHEVIQSGADGFLQKPFQPSTLHQKLQQLLGRSPA